MITLGILQNLEDEVSLADDILSKGGKVQKVSEAAASTIKALDKMSVADLASVADALAVRLQARADEEKEREEAEGSGTYVSDKLASGAESAEDCYKEIYRLI